MECFSLVVVMCIVFLKGVSLERIDEVFSQSWLKRIGCGLSKWLVAPEVVFVHICDAYLKLHSFLTTVHRCIF